MVTLGGQSWRWGKHQYPVCEAVSVPPEVPVLAVHRNSNHLNHRGFRPPVGVGSLPWQGPAHRHILQVSVWEDRWALQTHYLRNSFGCRERLRTFAVARAVFFPVRLWPQVDCRTGSASEPVRGSPNNAPGQADGSGKQPHAPSCGLPGAVVAVAAAVSVVAGADRLLPGFAEIWVDSRRDGSACPDR